MSQDKKATYEIDLGDGPVTVHVQRIDGRDAAPRYRVQIGEEAAVEVEALRPEEGVLSLLLDGRSWEAGLVPIDGGFVVDVLGIPHEAEVVDPRRRALRHAAGGGAATVKAQMPGRIVRILVEAGEAVEKGQPLLVVEAMKMENEIKAPMDATVDRIAVSAGDLVEARALLLELA